MSSKKEAYGTNSENCGPGKELITRQSHFTSADSKACPRLGCPTPRVPGRPPLLGLP